MKKRYLYFISFLICFILSLLIIIGGIYLQSYSKKEDTNNTNKESTDNNFISTYKCIKEENTENETVRYSYEITIDNENIVSNILKLKQYICSDKINYFYRIHSLEDKNVNYTTNDDNYTVTIYSYEGEVVDENSNILKVEKDKYINDLEKAGYSCN